MPDAPVYAMTLSVKTSGGTSSEVWMLTEAEHELIRGAMRTPPASTVMASTETVREMAANPGLVIL